VSDEPTGPRPLAEGVAIRDARPDDAEALLPLLRGYCDFYEVDPPDSGLLEMARAMASDPQAGALFVAERDGALLGFAAMDWKWAATSGARVGHLEDLFVDPEERGGGIADSLIERCAEKCRELGLAKLGWVTATDNHRAQRVYDRIGGTGSTWVEYELDVGRA
jgi:GNAT superfamily N-acetyltransferase